MHLKKTPKFSPAFIDERWLLLRLDEKSMLADWICFSIKSSPLRIIGNIKYLQFLIYFSDKNDW